MRSMRLIFPALMAAALLAALPRLATAAGEVKLTNLDAAQYQPGKLKLPLIVTERSGVARRGEIVSSGVPFPPGFLADVSKLAVVDAAGKPVVCQATMMVKWHKPAYDDSVQWALVSFAADVAPNATATYYLVDDGQTRSPDSPLKVTRDDAQVTVATGPGKFVVPLAGQALLASAEIDGQAVLGGKGLRSVIRSGQWDERKLANGGEQVGTHTAEQVTVEESGPARVVVCIKGTHAPGDVDGKFYGFTTRLYFSANSASVRVIHTIDNGELDATLIDGWRRIYAWPIEDASLLADLAAPAAKAVTLAENQPVSSDWLTVYQDSSGGEKWQQLSGGNYEKWLTGYTQGKTVRGVSFRGYKVSGADGKALASGNSHPGVIDVAAGKAGVTAALRNFRVEYPSAIAGGAGQLRVGLLPGEFAEPFHLNPGQRKSWDVRLTLHGADAPNLHDVFAAHDTLLLFRPQPEWMVRAGAAGAWPYGLAMLPPPNKPSSPRMDKDKLDGIDAGWDWFGWISGYNSGGGHWNEETVTAPWVLWGDGANFDVAEAKALWSADLTALHFNNPDLPALWLWLMSWNDHEPRIKRAAYPGYYNRDTWGLPDSGHMGMLMWPEYYFITGDMRAREAIEHLGNRARAFLWRYNYDDRTDGTGPTKGSVNWCKKQDPDADPDFKLATRYVGWPLFDAANAYRFSGDPQVLAECRTVARAFRNTARYSPIGFMVTQINAKGDKSVYGHQGPFDQGRAESASACYAHFQEGLMVTGLIEYYLMSRDTEALDAMVGFADCMVHHTLLRDDNGKPQGWTYAFGDYWGPYTWEQAGRKATWHVSNFVVIEDLGWIAQFTGRKDYADILAVALAERTGFNEAAALQAHLHPKADAVPPKAIADLKADALGDGKVKLTFTASGDDAGNGQAAWYQVKFTPAQLVERTKGWPDKTAPLPTNRAEWEARAAAFNAKQRAFWAAQTGKVISQDRQGDKVTLVIGEVPAGECNFAVKAWDDADNMSPMSNVTQAEVK